MKRTKLLLALGGLIMVVVLGTFAATAPPTSGEAMPANAALRSGSGPLDGRVFLSMLGQEGKPGDIEDELIFEDGMFVSTECERRCNYPASPYFVRHRDNALEFFSESRCPHKDATIVWRGVVEDGVIKGESTWTLKRWYWTVEKKFWFEGELAEQAVASIGD